MSKIKLEKGGGNLKNKRLMDKNGAIDISYVANLARIELTDEEKEVFSRQLGQIITYFEKLSKVDVSNVEPSAHAKKKKKR